MKKMLISLLRRINLNINADTAVTIIARFFPILLFYYLQLDKLMICVIISIGYTLLKKPKIIKTRFRHGEPIALRENICPKLILFLGISSFALWGPGLIFLIIHGGGVHHFISGILLGGLFSPISLPIFMIIAWLITSLYHNGIIYVDNTYLTPEEKEKFLITLRDSGAVIAAATASRTYLAKHYNDEDWIKK